MLYELSGSKRSRDIANIRYFADSVYLDLILAVNLVNIIEVNSDATIRFDCCSNRSGSMKPFECVVAELSNLYGSGDIALRAHR